MPIIKTRKNVFIARFFEKASDKMQAIKASSTAIYSRQKQSVIVCLTDKIQADYLNRSEPFLALWFEEIGDKKSAIKVGDKCKNEEDNVLGKSCSTGCIR